MHRKPTRTRNALNQSTSDDDISTINNSISTTVIYKKIDAKSGTQIQINEQKKEEVKPQETKKEKSPNKLCFVLDLDENMMSVALNAYTKPHQHLSDSAKTDLSHSADGFVSKPVLKSGQSGFSVTAFRRKEWNEFFSRIDLLNERYKKVSNDPQPLINCMILTNATYDKDNIFTILKQFYPNVAAKIFSSQDNYFNVNAQREVGANTKGDFVKYLYDGDKLGDVKASNVVLIDDRQENINSMQKYGFSGILNPSSPSGRSKDITYTTHGKEVFVQLNNMLNEAEKHVIGLEQVENKHQARL